MAGVKKSKQRDALLKELQSSHNHPTAEELYLSLKKEIPNLSLGTVYRNLNLLDEEGEINKISLDGADRYDGNIMPHCHFSCFKCGKVSDVFIPEDKLPITDDLIKSIDGDVEKYTLNFFGVCSECKNNI